jgi:hypothetical protein
MLHWYQQKSMSTFCWANLVYDDFSLAVCLGLQLAKKTRYPVVFAVTGELTKLQLDALESVGGRILHVNPIHLKKRVKQTIATI